MKSLLIAIFALSLSPFALSSSFEIEFEAAESCSMDRGQSQQALLADLNPREQAAEDDDDDTEYYVCTCHTEDSPESCDATYKYDKSTTSCGAAQESCAGYEDDETTCTLTPCVN